MIDIEVPVFNLIYQAVQEEHPECICLNTRPQSLAKFPAVVVSEDDNSYYPGNRGAEKYSELMYSVDIFCDDQRGAKTLCKELAQIVDGVLTSHNFTRMSLSPVPNTDPNIIRYTGRYMTVVSEGVTDGTDTNHILYRR